MTPSEVKQYLQSHPQVSLNDLRIHFDTDDQTIQTVMNLWIRKGKVKEMTAPTCSKGCCQCDPKLSTVYQWQEKTTADNLIMKEG